MRAQNSKLEFEEIDVASLRAHVTLCWMKINSWFDIERTAKDSVLNSCGTRIDCVPWSIVTISPFLLFFERFGDTSAFAEAARPKRRDERLLARSRTVLCSSEFFHRQNRASEILFYFLLCARSFSFNLIESTNVPFFPVCMCDARSLLITFFRLTKMCNYDHEAQSTKWT